MDLGKCPRCGEAWPTGDEICRKCGFIPIGAGLRAQTVEAEADEKARYRTIELDLGLEREPGSRPGLILSALLLIFVSVAYDQKIWVNQWQPLKVLMGAPKPPDIVGDWAIVSSEQLDKEGIAAKVQGLSGDFQFGKNGAARIHLYRSFDEMQATAQYSQNGSMIHLDHLEGNNGPSELPDQVDLSLGWRKGDQMQIDIQGQERVTLQRQTP